MRVGLRFPYEEIGHDPGALRSFVQAADELGFSHLSFIDHVLGAEHTRRDPPLEGPYDELTEFREPLTLMSWTAAHTRRVELATSVLVLPQRQAVLVARQASEIQLLSEGRLRLGVGSGWNPVEYESLGVPYSRRGARLEEQIEVMRRLWTEPIVDYTGSMHRIDRAALLPRPGTPIPIWFGGFSEAQKNRCARLGDGFVFRNPSSAARDAIAWIRDRAIAHGRDAGALGFDVAIRMSDGSADDVERWADAGGSHTTIWLVPRHGESTVETCERLAVALDIRR